MPDLPKVLVIDDQIGVRGSPSNQAFIDNYARLRYHFVFGTAEEGPDYYSVTSALSAVEQHSDACLIILDIMFGSNSDRLGVDILDQVACRYPTVPVIMMTSLEAEPATVVKCLRLGARDYITKGAAPEDLAGLLDKYARRITESHLLLGNSSKLRALRALVERVAQHAPPSVLISGERGTGKELVARSIHYLGRRRSGPFVPLNCAAIPRDLLVVELFGAAKGAYTGADRVRYGYVEVANGGVLFLDEISEAPPEVQATLLRVLESRKFQRVGDPSEIAADFQLLCATNADLLRLTAEKKFRSDLYDRIRGVEVRTVPLRECLDDLELLTQQFLREIRERLGGTSYHMEGFTEDALASLRHYSWPGNVRELRNLVEGAMIRARGKFIHMADLPPELQSIGHQPGNDAIPVLPGDGADLNAIMAEMELRYLSAAYRTADNNKARTIQMFYPGYAANYFDRIVFDAVKRSPGVLEKFPEFQDAFTKESQRRVRPN